MRDECPGTTLNLRRLDDHDRDLVHAATSGSNGSVLSIDDTKLAVAALRANWRLDVQPAEPFRDFANERDRSLGEIALILGLDKEITRPYPVECRWLRADRLWFDSDE